MKEKKLREWQDSNLQSPDPKSGALSIRPHSLLVNHCCKLYKSSSFCPGRVVWYHIYKMTRIIVKLSTISRVWMVLRKTRMNLVLCIGCYHQSSISTLSRCKMRYENMYKFFHQKHCFKPKNIYILMVWQTFATSGNRTRAARVAGEHSTTEPTLLGTHM